MVTTRTWFILLVIVAIVSAGLTRYYFPQIETQTVDKIKEVVKVEDHIVTRIIERPDGSKETIIDQDKHTIDNKTENHTETTYKNKDWLVNISGQVKRFDNPTIIYGAQVQRRILGPFYLGGMVDTNKRVGVSLGMEF